MRGKLESVIQECCINWFKYQYPNKIIYAIPNGGSRNIKEAINLKIQGVLAGVADLHIPIANKQYHSFFIELKAPYNKQTEKQIEFQKKVEKFGNKYIVCTSFDQFSKEVKAYFNDL